MKRLFLVRHAKSSWKDPELEDFDRPLNKRGKRDAPVMGQKLQQRKTQIDLIISSPAKRAKNTAEFIAGKISYYPREILWLESVYTASSQTLFNLVHKIEDTFQNVMLVGHNPGLTSLAERLTGREIDNIPTCGIVAVDFEVDSWKHIKDMPGKLVFFDYPKKTRP